MLSNIGPLEIGVILVVALMVFGPRRLPELGSSLGRSIRGFGEGIKGIDALSEEQPPDPESAKAE